MKENVILQISGLHSAGEDNESIEMIHSGRYFYRNGKHYIKYQESLEDGLVTDNMIKISPNEVELVRKGPMSTNMIFTMGEKNLSYYETPFGSMMMGIDTSDLCITEAENELAVDISYALDMNCQHMSDCHVAIKISEQECR
ncbi:MAG: DUF1934 domain-containing protein [Lachnospiraceae bacterium]